MKVLKAINGTVFWRLDSFQDTTLSRSKIKAKTANFKAKDQGERYGAANDVCSL